MKISFFIGSMAGGGAERVISILANYYSDKGWDVDIALLLKNEVGYKLNEKINIVDLSGKSGSYFRNLFGWVRKIRGYLKKRRPDRVVSFIGRINALVLMSTFGMKIPIIVSERNDPKHDGRGDLMLKICNKSYGFKRCKAIVHQTKYEESCFAPSLAYKSHVIPNPIEVKTEKGTPEKGRIVTAGRLGKQKRHTMLINAVAKLKDELPEIKTDIYGDGELKNSLQELIESKNMSDSIVLRGNVSNLHNQIANADVFVMTSDFEGLSNALLEAMMLGLPCISTNYPGADEVIFDGINGLLVPLGDEEELAKAIKRILNDGTLREELSNQALLTSMNYKKEVVLKLWESVIE
jgi:glycosyltransferase involved in cell wall biosynthesis